MSLVTRRDEVLSSAIQGAISRGLSLEALSSDKRDYQDKGRLASVVGNLSKETAKKRDEDKKSRSPPRRTTVASGSSRGQQKGESRDVSNRKRDIGGSTTTGGGKSRDRPLRGDDREDSISKNSGVDVKKGQSPQKREGGIIRQEGRVNSVGRGRRTIR